MNFTVHGPETWAFKHFFPQSASGRSTLNNINITEYEHCQPVATYMKSRLSFMVQLNWTIQIVQHESTGELGSQNADPRIFTSCWVEKQSLHKAGSSSKWTSLKADTKATFFSNVWSAIVHSLRPANPETSCYQMVAPWQVVEGRPHLRFSPLGSWTCTSSLLFTVDACGDICLSRNAVADRIWPSSPVGGCIVTSSILPPRDREDWRTWRKRSIRTESCSSKLACLDTTRS